MEIRHFGKLQRLSMFQAKMRWCAVTDEAFFFSKDEGKIRDIQMMSEWLKSVLARSTLKEENMKIKGVTIIPLQYVTRVKQQDKHSRKFKIMTRKAALGISSISFKASSKDDAAMWVKAFTIALEGNLMLKQ
mmetsp:Transcript_11619/g.16079  ORF Transcript_11619/g.16079 Transcript_11619/m.16079 type:complete len:132 (+) Transcript_11619:710-1105(+)